MPPTEILDDIFSCLSRFVCDKLLLVNLHFRDIVRNNFKNVPLRIIRILTVNGPRDYELSVDHTEASGSFIGLNVRCYDDAEFALHMTFCVVQNLRFCGFKESKLRGLTMDEHLLETLLPLATLWADGQCETPKKFSTAAVMHRALDELLLCKRLCVNIWQRPLVTPAPPFMSFKAVKECSELEVGCLHYAISESDFIDWLHLPCKWNIPKKLNLEGTEMAPRLFLRLLKKTFKASTSKCEFFVRLPSEDHVTADGDDFLCNDITSECLEIRARHFGFGNFNGYISAERRPLGNHLASRNGRALPADQ